MDNKQLYKISKYCYRENLLQYVLENSGTNLAKVQEKMARNPKYIKNQGIMMKITLFLYLLTINAALPIKVRDQAKSKLKWIFTILPTSLGLWWFFQIGSPDFWAITFTTLICLPIGPLIAIFNMIMTVRMFGKIKNKYVLEEINNRWKFWKYLSIIIFDTIIYIGLMILFLVNYNSAGIGKIAMILVPIEGILGVIAYFLFNWIFPK